MRRFFSDKRAPSRSFRLRSKTSHSFMRSFVLADSRFSPTSTPRLASRRRAALSAPALMQQRRRRNSPCSANPPPRVLTPSSRRPRETYDTGVADPRAPCSESRLKVVECIDNKSASPPMSSSPKCSNSSTSSVAFVVLLESFAKSQWPHASLLILNRRPPRHRAHSNKTSSPSSILASAIPISVTTFAAASFNNGRPRLPSFASLHNTQRFCRHRLLHSHFFLFSICYRANTALAERARSARRRAASPRFSLPAARPVPGCGARLARRGLGLVVPAAESRSLGTSIVDSDNEPIFQLRARIICSRDQRGRGRRWHRSVQCIAVHELHPRLSAMQQRSKCHL